MQKTSTAMIKASLGLDEKLEFDGDSFTLIHQEATAADNGGESNQVMAFTFLYKSESTGRYFCGHEMRSLSWNGYEKLGGNATEDDLKAHLILEAKREVAMYRISKLAQSVAKDLTGDCGHDHQGECEKVDSPETKLN